jgi:16S rRNA (guanine527-N7)-methyltransferase
MTQLAEKLAAGIAAMGLPVSAEMQQKLLDYLALLAKWNKVYNLTAVRNPTEMVTLHLLDSLSVLPYIKSKNLLDVGSGGGLPGIVLAICLPTLQVTTIDTVQKKAIFMRQVKGELSLDNLNIVHGRVEDFESEELFEAIISRAFSEINQFIALTQHLLVDGGHWYAMKGVSPEQELKCLKVAKSKVYPLSVAGLDAERHLAVIEKF